MKGLYTYFDSKHHDYNGRISPYLIHAFLNAITAYFDSTSNHKIIDKLNSELGSSRRKRLKLFFRLL